MRGNREQYSLNVVSSLIKKQHPECVITESMDKYAHYDLLIMSEGKKMLIEVKERMNKYCELSNFIQYSREGWMCEQIKWDFLVGRPHRYINMFVIKGETVIITWDLNNIVNKKVDMSCPKTTDFERNDKVNKVSTLLSPNEGTIYLKDGDDFNVVTFDNLIKILRSK
jgi:hypothetical protein